MKTTKALVGILAAFFLSSCVDSITETSSPGDAGTLTLAPRIVADGETELRGDKFELILTSGGRPVSKIDTLYSLVKGQRLVLGAVNIGDTFTIVARAYDTLPQKGRAYTWSGTFHGKAAGVTTTVQSDTIRVAAGPPLKVDTASGIFVPKGSYYTTDGKDPRDTASHATQASKDTILPKSGPIKFAKDTTIDGIKVWSLFSREYPIDPKLAFVGEWWEEWKDSGNRMITKWTLNSNGSFSYVDCDTVNFSTISGSVTGNWSANDTTFSYTHTKTTTAKILNASSDTFQLYYSGNNVTSVLTKAKPKQSTISNTGSPIIISGIWWEIDTLTSGKIKRYRHHFNISDSTYTTTQYDSAKDSVGSETGKWKADSDSIKWIFKPDSGFYWSAKWVAQGKNFILTYKNNEGVSFPALLTQTDPYPLTHNPQPNTDQFSFDGTWWEIDTTKSGNSISTSLYKIVFDSANKTFSWYKCEAMDPDKPGNMVTGVWKISQDILFLYPEILMDSTWAKVSKIAGGYYLIYKDNTKAFLSQTKPAAPVINPPTPIASPISDTLISIDPWYETYSLNGTFSRWKVYFSSDFSIDRRLCLDSSCYNLGEFGGGNWTVSRDTLKYAVFNGKDSTKATGILTSNNGNWEIKYTSAPLSGITAALARTAPPDYMDSLSRDDWWEIDSTKDSLGYVLRYTKMTHLRRSDSLLYEYVYYTEKLYTEPISTGWHADKTNLHINGNPTPSSYILTSDTLILTTDGTQKKYTHTMPSLLDPSVVGTWEDSITKISFKIESDGKVTFFKLATPTTGKEYSASSNGAFIYIYSLNSKNMAEYTPIAFKDGIAFDGINYYIKAQSGF